MQLSYRTPGVYFEWLDAPPALQPSATDIAGFVGIAQRGPLHSPLRVESWTQFVSMFGSHTAQGYLAYAVEGFFVNGGRACYVVRVADPDYAACASLDLLDANGWPALRLTAASPGVWARQMRVMVLFTTSDHFNLTLQLPTGEQEMWRNLTLEADSERYALRVLNGIPPDKRLSDEDLVPGVGRGCIVVKRDAETTPGGPPASFLVVASTPQGGPSAVNATLKLNARLQAGYLAGGEDGLWTLRPEHMSGRGAPPDRRWGLATLEQVPQVAIVAMPDLVPPPASQPRRHRPPPLRCDVLIDQPPPTPSLPDPDAPPVFSDAEVLEMQYELIGHCERLRDRFAILAPRPADTSPETVVQLRQQFDSSYAALYFPMLRVSDPLELDGLLRVVPPVGHVAGVYSRAEQRSGVHKPPANELLEGVQDVTVPVEDVLHGVLNDAQVNVIRAYPGRGVRIAGARTLSSDSLWRYVNVRRLLVMIERSIDVQTQWLVFEPNNPDSWRDLDRILRGFLGRLWQSGMLDGKTAEEAFTLVCNETSNPPAETDLGHLTAVIGVQPPWPAEFVVVRIGKTESGIEILGERGR
jgi:hypothetical protein